MGFRNLARLAIQRIGPKIYITEEKNQLCIMIIK